MISKEKQITGCADHNYIPELIPAKVLQVDDTFVVYEKDDFKFVNVAKDKQPQPWPNIGKKEDSLRKNGIKKF